EAAGQHDDHVATQRVDLVADRGPRTGADRHGDDDRGDADHDAEHRQERARTIAQQGHECHARDDGTFNDTANSVGFGAAESERIRPSRNVTVRLAKAATSGSWVTSMIVMPRSSLSL